MIELTNIASFFTYNLYNFLYAIFSKSTLLKSKKKTKIYWIHVWYYDLISLSTYSIANDKKPTAIPVSYFNRKWNFPQIRLYVPIVNAMQTSSFSIEKNWQKFEKNVLSCAMFYKLQSRRSNIWSFYFEF